MHTLKKSVYRLLLIMIVASCKKETKPLSTGKQNFAQLFFPISGNQWDQLPVPAVAVQGPPTIDEYNLSFAVNDKVYAVLRGYNQLWQYDPSASIWTLKQSAFFNFDAAGGGNDYYQYAFTNGNTVYFLNPGTKKLKQYNLLTAQWADKAAFPGLALSHITTSFTNTKGYAMAGVNGTDGTNPAGLSENWEYDFTGNTWTQKANTPGLARYNAASFAVGDKIYFGTGISTGLRFNPVTFQPYHYPIIDSDWYEYSSSANTWIRKADFAGGARQDTRGFVINGNIYMGLGSAGFFIDLRTDLWSYSPLTNAWVKRAPYPPGNSYPPYITFVGAAQQGYALKANITGFWRYTAPSVY